MHVEGGDEGKKTACMCRDRIRWIRLHVDVGIR
jgi:hypothetical protein